jgi:RNA polymerase sigma-54 factor
MWRVELNADTLPRRAGRQALSRPSWSKAVRARTETEKTFVADCMPPQANWLVKSLDQRAKTILKVSIRDRAPAGRLPGLRRRAFCGR